MNKQNLLKLYKYCVNYYCHKNHKDIYLTNDEWLNIFTNKRQYIKFLNIIKHKDILQSSNQYVDDCFFLSINYNVNKFKQILNLLKKNHIFYNFNIIEHMIDLPIFLSLSSISISENDLLQAINNNIKDEYIFQQALSILDKYFFYSPNFYYGKFLIAYLDYIIYFLSSNQYIPVYHIKELYNQFFLLNKFKSKSKTDIEMMKKLFNDIFVIILTNNTYFGSSILVDFIENLNIYMALNLNQQCINNIYSILKKEFIAKPLNTYIMYFTITNMEKAYQLINFNQYQKQDLINFINIVKAKYLLQII